MAWSSLGVYRRRVAIRLLALRASRVAAQVLDREVFKESSKPVDNPVEGPEGGRGIDEDTAGPHRLEQRGGLCRLRREGREKASQLMGRFTQADRVARGDGILNSGHRTGYGVLEDADKLAQQHRIVVAGREQRIRVDHISGLHGRSKPTRTAAVRPARDR